MLLQTEIRAQYGADRIVTGKHSRARYSGKRVNKLITVRSSSNRACV